MGIKTTTAAHIKILGRENPEGLVTAFGRLKSMILFYKPSLRIQVNSDLRFEVWTTREISIHGKTLRKGVMFASLVRLSHYVGFYFQPLYFDPSLVNDEALGDLMAVKTGLTCFHFTDMNPVLDVQVKMLLDKGWQSFKSKGWI